MSTEAVPVENGVAPRTAPAGGGGNYDGDGLPVWATALRGDVRTLSRDIKDLGRDFRSDVRDLGKEIRGGFRYQTSALIVVALLAMVLNSALILGSLYFRATPGEITIATENPPPSVAPVAP